MARSSAGGKRQARPKRPVPTGWGVLRVDRTGRRAKRARQGDGNRRESHFPPGRFWRLPALLRASAPSHGMGRPGAQRGAAGSFARDRLSRAKAGKRFQRRALPGICACVRPEIPKRRKQAVKGAFAMNAAFCPRGKARLAKWRRFFMRCASAPHSMGCGAFLRRSLDRRRFRPIITMKCNIE